MAQSVPSQLRRLLALAALAAALAACGASPQAPASQADPATATPGPTDPVMSTSAPLTAAPAPTRAPAAPPSAPAPPTSAPTADAAAQETTMPTSPENADGAGQPARPTLARPERPVVPVPTADPAAAVTGEVPQAILDPILADAAQRSSLDRGQLNVQLAAAVEWPDGSLGCPQPGMSYLQVIIPGYHVVVTAGAETYDYRVDDRGRFTLCPGGR